jgi:hypothetical protein
MEWMTGRVVIDATHPVRFEKWGNPPVRAFWPATMKIMNRNSNATETSLKTSLKGSCYVRREPSSQDD